jgi:hypothetical protein
VQDALPIVIVAVVVVGGLVAIVTLFAGGGAYDHIGRGGMTFDRESGRVDGPPSRDPHRDEEIRQMLEARNARWLRLGREPLDVDAELAALTRPAVDPGLALEIGQLVTARNARRVRQGKEPLDVEAEVARRLRELAD